MQAEASGRGRVDPDRTAALREPEDHLADGRPGGVLKAGQKRGPARGDRRVMFAPVARPAPPLLVDPALGNVGAELTDMVVDSDLGQEVCLVARVGQAAAEVSLLRVDEEAFVEKADSVEHLAPQEERTA